MKKCKYCGAELLEESNFCTECGKPIPQSQCPHCGAPVNDDDTFCQECGKRINEPISLDAEPALGQCPQCGADISEGDTFCQECGYNLVCGEENVVTINYEDAGRDVVEETESSSKSKYIILVIVGIIALALIGSWYFMGSSNTTADNETQSVVADSMSVETEDEAGSTEQVIEEKKRFLESFYKKYDSSEEYDEAYIKSIVTNNALEVLKKHYSRDEGGDDDPNGIACWLFNYYNGWVACGSVISRNIISKGGDTFLVSTKYKEVEKYEVELSVVKDGESYKINDIKPIGEDDGDMKSQEELAETNTAIGAFTVEENDDGNDSIR